MTFLPVEIAILLFHFFDWKFFWNKFVFYHRYLGYLLFRLLFFWNFDCLIYLFGFLSRYIDQGLLHACSYKFSVVASRGLRCIIVLWVEVLVGWHLARDCVFGPSMVRTVSWSELLASSDQRLNVSHQQEWRLIWLLATREQELRGLMSLYLLHCHFWFLYLIWFKLCFLLRIDHLTEVLRFKRLR